MSCYLIIENGVGRVGKLGQEVGLVAHLGVVVVKRADLNRKSNLFHFNDRGGGGFNSSNDTSSKIAKKSLFC